MTKHDHHYSADLANACGQASLRSQRLHALAQHALRMTAQTKRDIPHAPEPVTSYLNQQDEDWREK